MKGIDVKGAVVVVTGASSGIGQAIAEAFAAQGAKVVLAARDKHALKQVAAHCRRLGGKAKAVEADITDAGAVRKLADAARRFGGRIDVWVSNAGVGALGRFEDTPIKAHARVVETNLVGHMTDAHAVLPVFKAQRHGTFINMISLGGFVSTPFSAAYSASKFGLRGFSEALRAELSGYRDIHVCDVYPAFVDTPGVTHAANYTGKSISAPPPPVFDARKVADKVVELARHPKPTTTVGVGISAIRLLHAFAPNLIAALSARATKAYLKKAPPADDRTGNLYRPPATAGGIDGGYKRVNRVLYGGGAALAVAALAGIGAVVAVKKMHEA